MPKKNASILQTVCRYFCSSGSLTLKFFLSMCPDMT
jgi:hypothetical protein